MALWETSGPNPEVGFRVELVTIELVVWKVWWGTQPELFALFSHTVAVTAIERAVFAVAAWGATGLEMGLAPFRGDKSTMGVFA